MACAGDRCNTIDSLTEPCSHRPLSRITISHILYMLALGTYPKNDRTYHTMHCMSQAHRHIDRAIAIGGFFFTLHNFGGINIKCYSTFHRVAMGRVSTMPIKVGPAAKSKITFSTRPPRPLGVDEGRKPLRSYCTY